MQSTKTRGTAALIAVSALALSVAACGRNAETTTAETGMAADTAATDAMTATDPAMAGSTGMAPSSGAMTGTAADASATTGGATGAMAGTTGGAMGNTNGAATMGASPAPNAAPNNMLPTRDTGSPVSRSTSATPPADSSVAVVPRPGQVATSTPATR